MGLLESTFAIDFPVGVAIDCLLASRNQTAGLNGMMVDDEQCIHTASK